MKKLHIILFPVLALLLFGSICSGDEETQFLAERSNGPIMHYSQPGPNDCVATCGTILILFNGGGFVPPLVVKQFADSDGSGIVSLSELHEYLFYSHGIDMRRYYKMHYGPITDSLARAYTQALADCNNQGAAPIVPIVESHTVIVAGYCKYGAEVTAMIICDPANPDTARDKYNRIDYDNFAEYGYSFVNNAYIMLSNVVTTGFFTVIRSEFDDDTGIEPEPPIAKNVPSDPTYTDRITNPDFPAWGVDAGEGGGPIVPDSILEIWTKADQALFGKLSQSFLYHPAIRDRYGSIFDNTYYEMPIYTSSANPWNPPVEFVKAGTAPSIYMVVVPIYSFETYDLVGAVCLKYGCMDSCLSILALPPKPNYDKSACRPFLRPADLQDYYGNLPQAFVSELTRGVTSTFPELDLPNYIVVDSATNDTLIMTPFGDELGFNEDDSSVYFTGQTFKVGSSEQSGGGETPIVENFELRQNYPNPFNPETHISFAINEPGHVTLEIYNIMGRKVIALIDEELQAGSHTITWDGKSKAGNGVATGLYLYKLSFNGDVKTRKMVLLK